ncbi:ty3-gypsy retrotransposon protein [Tanacetum coccineum]
MVVDNEDSYPTTQADDLFSFPAKTEHAPNRIPFTEMETSPQHYKPTPYHPQFLSLSPATLLWATSPRTLRVTGHIEGHAVTILVDSGSTHNIIQPRIASFLNLAITPIPSFPVMIGNGADVVIDSYPTTQADDLFSFQAETEHAPTEYLLLNETSPQPLTNSIPPPSLSLPRTT